MYTSTGGGDGRQLALRHAWSVGDRSALAATSPSVFLPEPEPPLTSKAPEHRGTPMTTPEQPPTPIHCLLCLTCSLPGSRSEGANVGGLSLRNPYAGAGRRYTVSTAAAALRPPALANSTSGQPFFVSPQRLRRQCRLVWNIRLLYP